MSSQTYKCKLCYTSDHFNNDSMTLEKFLLHLINDHQSPKAKNILETLENFGVDKTKPGIIPI